MTVTPEQRIQILCATLQSVIPHLSGEIEAFPGKIAEQAVVIAKLTIAQAEKTL